LASGRGLAGCRFGAADGLASAGPGPRGGLDAGLAALVGDQKGLAWLGLLSFRLGLFLLRFPAGSLFLLGLLLLGFLMLGLFLLGVGIGGIGGLRVFGGLAVLVGVPFVPFPGVGICLLRVGVA
jgi:hypothetical protein